VFTFGHVRQLDRVAAQLLSWLSAATPGLTGADQAAFIDIDDTVRQAYGYRQAGQRACGNTGVKRPAPAEPVGVAQPGQLESDHSHFSSKCLLVQSTS
jgi:hypothetical protein